MDLTASILAATGTPVPAEARLEGINLFPILEGRSPVVERTLFWRTATPATTTSGPCGSGDWKLLIDGNHFLVFDLRKDIGERNDMANERQDVARRLQSLLAAWEADVNMEAQANGTDRIRPRPRGWLSRWPGGWSRPGGPRTVPE